jgi:hypothetical protein
VGLPEAAVGDVARQVDVPPEAFAAYDWGSRVTKYQRAQVRKT